MTSELPPRHDPESVEREAGERWLAAEAFHARPDDPGEGFSMVIPPPNVTAALHLGHALNNTLQDVLTRWRRMRGDNAMWMPGTDHAGIATQTVVEKRVLQEEGMKRTEFSRDAFVAKIEDWKDTYEKRITDQLRAMGCSCDWPRQRFTMDPVCAAAVREAFFRLFRDRLIYRGKRLVNWDPVTRTALADDEVEMTEVDGHFWDMRYPLLDTDGRETGEYATVATTRPETMLGDTAVAVNPEDPERKHLIGARVRVPIVDRVVPVIGDEHVVMPDPDSEDPMARQASGFLKVTPAHDPNDYAIGERHGLQMINVMAPDASVSLEHGWADAEPGIRGHEPVEPFLGLSREEARTRIVEWFRERGLLAAERPHRHVVGHSYRSHVPVEPYLSSQWYVRVTDDRLAGAALRAMDPAQRNPSEGCAWKDGDPFDTGHAEGAWTGGLRFTPPGYAKTYQQWHEQIRDWCISRQLWWGHRIPVWSKEGPPSGTSVAADKLNAWEQEGRISASLPPYSHQSNSYVCVRDETDHEVIQSLESEGFERDEDVLDTWFSSALWPLSTMGWPDPDAFPDQIPEGRRVLEAWNPTNTLCTAREIITLWVSRMVMFNVYFSDPAHARSDDPGADLDWLANGPHLPFSDVFVHAMIQDGAGQKMSKSLGNGVDPMDIIHSHGADAMRFTLASMTTHTQDVRLPVDLICPHTGEVFEPETVTTKEGYRVAAPVQKCPSDASKEMVSSYGVNAGSAEPTDQRPLARNTSSKFDLGRNFANKLWNATRFAVGPLAEHGVPAAAPATADLGLCDRWILARFAATAENGEGALAGHEFSRYARELYDLVWRDLCDWYLEAVKPTVGERPERRAVLAACLDAALRLLHPAMPFVTEKLFAELNRVAPGRADAAPAGWRLPGSELLARAAWPEIDASWRDAATVERFERLQELVSAIREIRTTHRVAPRERVTVSARATESDAAILRDHAELLAPLANADLAEASPPAARPADAAANVVGETEVYVHGVIDPEAERERLERRRADVVKRMEKLKQRLDNPNYVEKAPAHLVEESRSQYAEAEKELAAIDEQLGAIGSGAGDAERSVSQ